MKHICFQALVLVAAVLCPQAHASTGLIWPTPNPAFQEGRPLEDFIQPTTSGKLESGLFGCVRNGGARFHEGLDFFPIKRDSRGEALDDIYSILPGRVVHVSAVAGHSSYGRYVVVEHDGEALAFHTLYAHLATIGPGIQVGARVQSGTVLGKMGRSAAGYSIPSDRAHLHFEIGFKLTDTFQVYYDRQEYRSKNHHGNWNGMNLVSIDPLAFYRAAQAGKVQTLAQHLKTIPVVARIRVHSSKVPSFVRNFPTLVTRPYAGKRVVAWDIAFTQYGMPKEWTPRFVEEQLGGRVGDVRVLTYSPRLLTDQTCRKVLNTSGSHPSISKVTITTLKKLFGFK
ncbi:MAG: M23 family metallopeptidase [Lentimonas sp.]